MPTESKYEEIEVVDILIRYPEEEITLTIFPEDQVEGGDDEDIVVTKVGDGTRPVVTRFYREARRWITRRERKYRRPITEWVPPSAQGSLLEAPDDPDPSVS